jgi:hypothetical protein
MLGMNVVLFVNNFGINCGNQFCKQMKKGVNKKIGSCFYWCMYNNGPFHRNILVMGSPVTIQIYITIKKTCTDLFPLKKTTHYHKNERQHTHGQYNSRVS